jgi:4-amino-4-deoxy-L-arabinose transferase-like glycosyltransferase
MPLHTSRQPLSIMVALLLAATFLRIAGWLDAPPGMRYDEMTVVVEADRIRLGDRPIYMDGSAEEALYHYLFAISEDLIAPQLFTQRWLSAALGLIAVAAIYALGRRMFNLRVGLLAAAISVGAFWALMYSRMGLRLIALPAFVLLGLIFLWRGLDRSRRIDFILAGALLGLSAYTYSATRMLPLILIFFLAYLLLFKRDLFRRQAINIGLTLILGLAIAAPMAIHIATVPAAERRLGEVEGPLDALQRGDVMPLINSTIITAGMFIAGGDPESLYNIPNRPVFDLLTGAIFYIGVLICLKRVLARRSPSAQLAHAFILIWLLFGLAPPMLTWPAASNSHGLLAQSPAFLIAAIGLDAIATRVSRLKPDRSTALSGTLLVLVLTVHTLHSTSDYFNVWANDPGVRVEYAAGLTATARYFAQQPVDQPLGFSSGDVTQWNPWSSTAFRMIAPIGYSNARWFDARSSFVFPHGATDLTLINSANEDAPAPLDSRLIEDLFPSVEPAPFATEAFSATRLSSSLNTRLITLTQASVSWPGEAGLNQAARLPIEFGDQLELIGYEVRRSIVQPGKNIRLTTYWRAQDIGLRPLSIFMHVLNDRGEIAAQWDGFTIDQHYIQPGDILVQVHFIPISSQLAEGTYRLQLGLYSTDTLQRLPALLNGQPAADRILLQSIAIKK